jgi:hypothetical protein
MTRLFRCLYAIVTLIALAGHVPHEAEASGREESRLGIAAMEMVFAHACHIRFGQPQLVKNAKAAFLKAARKELPDPEAATERAYRSIKENYPAKDAAAASHHTRKKCTELDKILRAELSR